MRVLWFAVLLLLAVPGSAQTTACGAGETLATVSFAQRVPDASVEAFIRGHEVTPHAVFMWSHGISGTFRPPVAERATTVQGARASAVKNFERALNGVAHRAGALVERYTRADVERYERAASEARSLLRRRTQHDTILREARANVPLIYAIAVCARPDALARLQSAGDVKVAVSTDNRAAARPERPVAMTNEFRAPEIDRLAAGDVYARLQSLARAKRSGDHAHTR